MSQERVPGSLLLSGREHICVQLGIRRWDKIHTSWHKLQTLSQVPLKPEGEFKGKNADPLNLPISQSTFQYLLYPGETLGLLTVEFDCWHHNQDIIQWSCHFRGLTCASSQAVWYPFYTHGCVPCGNVSYYKRYKPWHVVRFQWVTATVMFPLTAITKQSFLAAGATYEHAWIWVVSRELAGYLTFKADRRGTG